MKLNNDFVLRNVAGDNYVFPVGDTSSELSGVFAVNESGVLLWQALEKGVDRLALTELLVAEYDISFERAEQDVSLFLEKLGSIGCLEF